MTVLTVGTFYGEYAIELWKIKQKEFNDLFYIQKKLDKYLIIQNICNIKFIK
jgi:hypothetical protein